MRMLPGFTTVSDESPDQQHARFARIRRAKWLLRFTPRRASLHRYPFIGRFADFARKRSYLWSFRTDQVRPALYAGSIIALLPILGVQIPVAFVLAIIFRSNVMLLVGLQFITNPFTAWFIYPATYQVGRTVIEATGFGSSIEVSPSDHAYLSPEALASYEPDDGNHEHLPHVRHRWTQRLGTAINALVLGGVIVGSALGLVLDLIWRFSVSRAGGDRGPPVRRRGDRSGSTTPRPPPM
jgi:uncharacterized protein